MKIYPNSPCPCGSGKKYKKCCANKGTRQIASFYHLPVDQVSQDDTFFVNRRGAVIFKDESLQPVLDIPEGDVTKRVLSVGFTGSYKPMATIVENDAVMSYILPDWYFDWCQSCVNLAARGVNLFPADVEFANDNGEYSVHIF